MSESWESRYVDKQVDQAWLDLRLRLADRLAAALDDGGGMEGLGISGPNGQKLTVLVEDGNVVVLTDQLNTATTDNVDEAAHAVYRVLHDDWQVVHPAFLDTELVDSDSFSDSVETHLVEPASRSVDPWAEPPPGEPATPLMATAESEEQLRAWVVATLERWLKRKVKVGRDGSIAWNTRGKNRVVLNVRNAGRIELNAVLAREVSFKRAHMLIDELSRKWFGLKFFLERDALIVSQVIVAHPFVAPQLPPALKAFMRDVDRLGWVQETVERKRTQKLRNEVEQLRRLTRELTESKSKAESERDRAKRAYRKIRRELRAERESRDEE